MPHVTKILLSLSLIFGMGSMGASITYAWYLHSPLYRDAVQRRVSDYLGLPVEIQVVEALSLRSKRLLGVRSYLPDRRACIFECALAVWQERRGEAGLEYELKLNSGALTIGSQQWRKPDYRRIVESGFAHDFAELKLKRVLLSDMDVNILRRDWSLRIRDADGLVVFGADGAKAHASLESKTINDYTVGESISVTADFTPGKTLLLHEVKLTVPSIPITHLNLDRLLTSPVTTGRFQGEIIYRESEPPVVEIKGFAEDLVLSEWTAALPNGPFSGHVQQVIIHRAIFERDRLRLLEFSADLSDLQITEAASLFDRSTLTGKLNLRIDRGRIVDGRIAELQGGGSANDIDLPALMEAIGLGPITGRLDLSLADLHIVDDKIVSAELVATVRAPQDGPATIDRSVIQAAAEAMMNVPLPNLPLQHLEYVELGARLIITGSKLRIKGTHGDGNRAILSVRFLGEVVPLIREPRQAFDLEDLVALARDKAKQYDLKKFIQDKFRRDGEVN